MPAGMRDKDLLVTAVALRHHLWALCGAALLQRGQGLKLAGQYILIRRQKLGFKGSNDRREQYHFTCFQSMIKPSINALINASA